MNVNEDSRRRESKKHRRENASMQSGTASTIGVPFGFAQGRLSTAFVTLRATNSAQDDSSTRTLTCYWLLCC
jgi:hypothetical protein